MFHTFMQLVIFHKLKILRILIFSQGKLGNVFNKKSNIHDYSKWIKSTKNDKTGFTRLDQDSDNEAEPLDVSSDSDEVTVPNKV